MKTHRRTVGLVVALVPFALLWARPRIQMLIVPPAGQYYVERFWSLTLYDSPDSWPRQRLWLEGELTEARRGQVYSAKTGGFEMRPGERRVLRHSDIRAIGIISETHAPGYEQLSRRSGGLPEGTYTFTVRLMPNLDRKSTPPIEVRPISAPRLIAPADGANIGQNTPPFTWAMPPRAAGGVTFALRIAEVEPGMTKEEAMASPSRLFERKGITGVSFVYPTSAPPLQKGQQYAWQVTAFASAGESAQSEVWPFTLRNAGPGPDPESTEARPDWNLVSPAVDVPGAGDSLSAHVTVRNTGSGDAPRAALRIQLKSTGALRVVDVRPLKPRTSQACTCWLARTSTGETDTVLFEVIGQGDANADNNRAAVGFGVPPPKKRHPDLAVAEVSHRFAAAGARLTLIIRVANVGDIASGPTRLEVTCTPPAWPRRVVAIPSILQGGPAAFPVEFDIPPTLRGETVRFSVLVEEPANEAYVENNSRLYIVTIPQDQRPPNLSLSNAGSDLKPGDSALVFWVTAENCGTAGSGSTKLELTPAGGDVLGAVDVLPLDPTGRQTCTLTVAVPPNLRGKTTEFTARIDPDNNVQESDETDNTISVPVTIPSSPGPVKNGDTKRPNWPLRVLVAIGVAAAAAAVTWLAVRAAKVRRAKLRSRPSELARPEAPPEEAMKKAVPPERLAGAGAAAAGAVRKVKDDVYFTVTSPAEVAPKADFLVNVWAHLDAQREEVLKRARQAEPDTKFQVPGVGPFTIARDTELDVRLEIADCTVDSNKETIRWTGTIANANFAVRVNDGAAEGSKPGRVFILYRGLEIARVRFLLKVTATPSAAAATDATAQTHRKAFASYARADSYDVLTCVQGMEKALPGLNIFLDVLKFRSGEYWQTRLQKEILESDTFYLFWSKAAAQSEWVEKEWRFGLEKKGLDFIDPVPLVSPREVPPPPELSAKHFDDLEVIVREHYRPVGSRPADAGGGM